MHNLKTRGSTILQNQSELAHAAREMERQYNWSALREELALWRQENLTLPFWWRDDDAEDVTPALARLLSLSRSAGVPLHLAVVPRNATQKLAKELRRQDQLRVVVHGWAHVNHEPDDQPNSEFGCARPTEASLEEAAEGLRRLKLLFGAQCAPMFVPPWTNISPHVAARLHEIGYETLSTINSRDVTQVAEGVAQINAHLDPVAWREDKRLQPPTHLFKRSVEILRARRCGKLDNAEPFGLLTHHKALNEDVWAFTERFLNEICAGPVAFYISSSD